MGGNIDEINRAVKRAFAGPTGDLATVAAPIDTKKLAKTVATLQHAVAAALAEAHHKVWPEDLDIEYRVIQRNGKVKIAFSHPFSKEPGYKDA